MSDVVIRKIEIARSDHQGPVPESPIRNATTAEYARMWGDLEAKGWPAVMSVADTRRLEDEYHPKYQDLPTAVIEPFVPQTQTKTWGHEVLVAHTAQYTGKVLYRYAAEPWHRAGLQWHRTKDETFYLHEGCVIVYWVDADGMLRQRRMVGGQSFHVPPGAIHSVQTVTDSVMFEASTPVFDDRVNVEADYDITQAVES